MGQRNTHFALGLVLLAVVLSGAGSSTAAAGPEQARPGNFVAVFHCDYPPVSFWDNNAGVPSGFFVDSMNAVEKRAGVQVSYSCRNGWSELIEAVESGQADLTVLLKSDEREKKLAFSSPIDITILSFFARSTNPLDPDSLTPGQTVGVVTGSMSYEQLKNRPGMELHIVGTYHEGILSLLAGEIALFAGEESMILKRARETRLDDRIKRVGKPFVERERGIAVRKDRAALLEPLNAVLPQFVGSDEYERIYLKWYGAPTPYWTGKRIAFAGGFFLFVVVCGMAYWRYRSLEMINKDLREQISERRKAESDLMLFKNLVNRSSEAIFVNDPRTGRFMDVNDHACRCLGYDRAELLELGVRDIETAFSDEHAWQEHGEEVRRQGSLLVTGMLRRKDGATFPVETNVSIVKQDEREYMIAVVRDISERQRAEAALRMREQQLAESQRIAHIGSWQHNLTTHEAVWSDELFRLLGLDPARDEADFDMFLTMVHPDDQPALKAAIKASVTLHAPFDIEYRLMTRDGGLRMIHAKAELLHDRTGVQNILSGTGQDITERRIAEEKSRHNEQFIRKILDTVDEGFIVIDRQFRILTANKAYCGQAGMSCDEVIGKNCFKISHGNDRPCYEEGEECAVRKVFETGEPHAVLHRHTDNDGHVLYVETKAFPIKDEDGDISAVIETVNNITERHLLEEERLKTQKLESIGTLAGGIAHDFNNLLQGIFGYISLAKMNVGQKERALSMLQQAEKALHQSVNLTTQLLTFSKGGRPVKKPVDLTPVIENAARFALSGSRSDCRIQIEPGLWLAEADGGQIGQVIQNIVLNADQAMPRGGSVTVTAKNLEAGEPSLPCTLAPGSYIGLSVTDNGVGIPEDNLGKIFDPYFTTKEKGSGLGLATSYSIVKNHDGMINVVSRGGEGATFTIYLPALAGPGRSWTEEGQLDALPQRRMRVLVMDDEDMVRHLSRELLSALGHDVDIAQHGQEAIEKYQAALNADKFDAVILDLTVRGGMGGADTFKKLREIDPSVKAIVSTGYSDDAAIADHLSLGFKAFLKKPYDITELRDTLSALQA